MFVENLKVRDLGRNRRRRRLLKPSFHTRVVKEWTTPK
jgi:hypothetical protein